MRRSGSRKYVWYGGTLALLAIVVIGVVASAQAATSTKLYDATVHLAKPQTASGCGTHTCFTVILTNDGASQQTLGSANFTPPGALTANSAGGVTVDGQPSTAWTASVNAQGAVELRATSSATAIAPGHTVTANVDVTVPQTCTSSLWFVAVKQSNDFKGTNNSFQPGSGIFLTPLKTFVVPDVKTTVNDLNSNQSLDVLQIYNTRPYTETVSALDTCGKPDKDYSGAALTHTFLTGATFDPTTDLVWDGKGSGTVTFTPAAPETQNTLTVTDPDTGVSVSTPHAFTVVEKLCTSFDQVDCHWDDPGNSGIHVDALKPPGNKAGLGIGFNSTLSFVCGTSTTPLGGVLVNIDPEGYPVTNPVTPVTVTLTYDKSVSGSGPASAHDVCLSKPMPVLPSDWTAAASTPLLMCPTATSVKCILSRKRITSGALQIILSLDPSDPWPGAS